MNARTKKTLWGVLNLVLTVALLIFAYSYITDLIDKAQLSEVAINWGLIGASCLLFGASYIFFAYNWWLSSRLLDKTAGKDQTLAFLASLPFKYLPTSLFTFSSRAYFGKMLGLSLKQSSLALVFESISLIGANLCLFAVLYIMKLNLVAGTALLFIICLGMYAFLRLKKSITIRFQKRKLVVMTKELAKMLGLSAAGWLVCGLAFVTMVDALGISVSILGLLAANTIAFSVSMIAFFAPGGIGVRELIYAGFGVHSVAIIYWRILVFVLDFVIGVPAILLVRRRKKPIYQKTASA